MDCLQNDQRSSPDLLKPEGHAVDMPSSGAARGASSPRPSRLHSALVGMSLAIGLIGLILGAWATSEVRNMRNRDVAPLTNAILVASPKQVPAGYSLVMNVFRGTGYWSTRPPMVYARSDFGAATYEGKAYVFGGLSNAAANSSTPQVLTSIVEYDPVANSTRELAPMPRPLMRFGWAVVGRELFLFGGVDAYGSFTAVGGTMVYSFATNTWTDLPNAAMKVARSDLCADTINGKIYAVGGGGAKPEDSAVIEEFDPAAGTWKLLGSRLGVARLDCGAVASGGKLFIMGGAVFSQPAGVDCFSNEFWKCYSFSSAVERFDPADGSVARLTDMRNARGDFGAVEASPGTILVAGGEGADSALNVSRLLSQPWVEEYSVEGDWWTPKAPLPESRFRFAMARAGGQVLAFGGHPTCANITAPDDETGCLSGLRTVFAFDDVQYPPAYVAVRSGAAGSDVA